MNDKKNRYVILDRDGTLIVDKNYLHDPDEVELLPGVVDGLKKLISEGYGLIVVTNQSGVGRGYFGESEVQAVNSKLSALLNSHGIDVLGFYHCPHTPEDNCGCRKPAIGMVCEACRELCFSLGDVQCVIGDKTSDVSLADNLGVPSVLVLTGYGESCLNNGASPSFCAKNMMEAANYIINYEEQRLSILKIFDENIEENIRLLKELRMVGREIERAVSVMTDSLKNNGRIFVCGNGGSAADAQHMAAELSGRFLKERKALDAMALSSNPSVITAVGNDYSFAEIFARQVEAHGRGGDVLIAISTSGNSMNIVNAVKKAKKIGIHTIGLTGCSGGEITKITDILIKVPSSSVPRIQEMHLLIEHTLCEMTEQILFPGDFQ